MKKTFLAVLAAMVILAVLAVSMVGCATTKKGMWQGDWNWPYLKWAAETHLDSDLPKTIIQNKNGTVLIFQ